LEIDISFKLSSARGLEGEYISPPVLQFHISLSFPLKRRSDLFFSDMVSEDEHVVERVNG
jgi:hypothetical protein